MSSPKLNFKKDIDDIEKEQRDLRLRLNNLELKRKELERELQRRRAALVTVNVDALLNLVPEHEGACSDASPNRGYADHGEARCTRCALLSVKSRDDSDFIAHITLKSIDNDDDE